MKSHNAPFIVRMSLRSPIAFSQKTCASARCREHAVFHPLGVARRSERCSTTVHASTCPLCFPDMKHILDNFVISDVRLTTGKIRLEIVAGSTMAKHNAWPVYTPTAPSCGSRRLN